MKFLKLVSNKCKNENVSWKAMKSTPKTVRSFFHISYWYLSCNTIENRQLTNPNNKSRAGQGFGSLLAPSQMGRSPINCQAFTGGAWCSLVSFPNPLESEVESLPRCSPPPHPLPVGRANGSVGAGSCHPLTAHFWGRSPVWAKPVGSSRLRMEELGGRRSTLLWEESDYFWYIWIL